jgi:hypothetical protein
MLATRQCLSWHFPSICRPLLLLDLRRRAFITLLGSPVAWPLPLPETRCASLPQAQDAPETPAGPWGRPEYARFWPKIAHSSAAG